MRYLVALSAALLISARVCWPDLTFDDISLTLFIIASLALLVPDIGGLINRVRKIKHGNTEIELDENISTIAKSAEELEKSNETLPNRKLSTSAYTPEVSAKIENSANDPRAALLLLSIELEKSINNLARKLGLAEKAPLIRTVWKLEEKGVFSNQLALMFRDYWHVKNKIAHGVDHEISREHIYAMVNLGLVILKQIPTDPSPA